MGCPTAVTWYLSNLVRVVHLHSRRRHLPEPCMHLGADTRQYDTNDSTDNNVNEDTIINDNNDHNYTKWH